MNRAIAFAIFALLFFRPVPAHAWDNRTHQEITALAIAHLPPSPLKVNPAMIPVMGGMTLAEAEAFVAQHEARQKTRRNAAARARHTALTSLGLKRTPYGYE